MARIDKDGNITGRISNIIYYTLNGKQVARSKPLTMNQPNSPAQVAAREKVRLCGEFSKDNLAIINIGYQATTMRAPVLESNSYHMKNAVIQVVDGPKSSHQEFDYSKSIVSRGLIDRPLFSR